MAGRPKTPSDAAGPPGTLTARVALKVGEERVEIDLTVPSAEVTPREILPALWSLSEAVVASAERSEAARGRAISCCAGCGACCRQIVPITEPEARFLRDAVAAMPEPRRATVTARFAEAVRRLDESALGEGLRSEAPLAEEESRELALSYFRLGLACPFLEEESCSIHPIRPLACREYLVTSPAENCASPSPETIDRVPMPARLSRHLASLARPDAPDRRGWVPLALALEWAATHPDDSPTRPGPEWVGELFRRWGKGESSGPGG